MSAAGDLTPEDLNAYEDRTWRTLFEARPELVEIFQDGYPDAPRFATLDDVLAYRRRTQPEHLRHGLLRVMVSAVRR